jgi:uncharacterized protein DUF4190
MDQYDGQPDEYDTIDGEDEQEPLQEPVPQSSEYGVPDPVVPTSVFCVQCGYNLTGVAIGSTCPECGRTVAPSFHGQMLPTSGKAVASMVLGICSIVGCVMYGIPSLICGPLAIIFAIMAKKQVARGEAGSSSTGMATAGLICGIIGLTMVVLFIGLIAVMIALDSF